MAIDLAVLRFRLVLWQAWQEPNRWYAAIGLAASTSYFSYHQGRAEICGYKVFAMIAIFVNGMACVSPELGELRSARRQRMFLDFLCTFIFYMHLWLFPPVPRYASTLAQPVTAAPCKVVTVK
ncbi:hypothetical protein JKP88DRAFT_245277 [Tribonema minus]|uniref:Uncharacterized protein n=1 Tax=Tribonema minus TaxID=303371 RepID=A0A836CEE8_9STRA|nr:hypothetical protein JKP88DRAFT_245277 [Tribonema minus]